MHKLALAIQWREDVDRPEMIETPGYNRTYLAYRDSPYVSQEELDAICEAVNLYYILMGDNKRINNHMGELIPGVKVNLT